MIVMMMMMMLMSFTRICWIWGCHSSDSELYYLLEYDAMYSVSSPTFRKNILFSYLISKACESNNGKESGSMLSSVLERCISWRCRQYVAPKRPRTSQSVISQKAVLSRHCPAWSCSVQMKPIPFTWILFAIDRSVMWFRFHVCLYKCFSSPGECWAFTRRSLHRDNYIHWEAAKHVGTWTLLPRSAPLMRALGVTPTPP
jgi:hypothetical protein